MDFRRDIARRIGGRTLDPPEALRGRKVGLLAAIARPDRLRAELGALGAEVSMQRVFADHHCYRRSDIASLDPGVTWVTTEKDAVKIPASWAGETEICVLEQEVRPSHRGALIDFVLENLQRRRASL